LDALITRVRAAGLPVSYEVQGAAFELPAGLQLTSYRLVQEALTNTLKHAGAGAEALVRLRCQPDQIAIEIVDDGRGSTAGGSGVAEHDGGRGLTGMVERVQSFGGQLHSGRRAGGGWQVSARLPLDDVPGVSGIPGVSGVSS
jgi:signal transduction histidine kinase